MTAIDVWAQITTERMARAPWMETLLRWTGRTGDMSIPTVETTLQAVDAAGVETALLSAWHGPEGALISNEEVRATDSPILKTYCWISRSLSLSAATSVFRGSMSCYR